MMPTKVNITSEVQKEIKRLKRKYASVTIQVRKLVMQLENDERPGDKIQGVGYDVYKVRLPNPSAQRGKSGGFRVIYYVKVSDIVILVNLYSKTEQVNISAAKIRQIISEFSDDQDQDEE